MVDLYLDIGSTTKSSSLPLPFDGVLSLEKNIFKLICNLLSSNNMVIKFSKSWPTFSNKDKYLSS